MGDKEIFDDSEKDDFFFFNTVERGKGMLMPWDASAFRRVPCGDPHCNLAHKSNGKTSLEFTMDRCRLYAEVKPYLMMEPAPMGLWIR